MKKQLAEVQAAKNKSITPKIIADLEDVFLDICDIFPREVTEEVYRVLGRLLLLSLEIEVKVKDPPHNLIVALANEIAENKEKYYFLTGKFTKIYLPEKEVTCYLYPLFKDIVRNFKELIKNGKVIKA